MITDDECDEINVVMVVIEAPEEADRDALFAAFVAAYGDGRGGLDPQRKRREGYLSHEARRLFSTWLARRPSFRRLLFEELNTRHAWRPPGRGRRRTPSLSKGARQWTHR